MKWPFVKRSTYEMDLKLLGDYCRQTIDAQEQTIFDLRNQLVNTLEPVLFEPPLTTGPARTNWIG